MLVCLTSRANGSNNYIIKLLTSFRGVKMDKNGNVEDVMRQIKENIKTRRECNSPKENVSLDESKSPDLDYVKSNWDIRDVEYTISSHRPVIGRLLVWGRKFVHGEVRRYVDLVAKKQAEFNSRTADILNNLDRKINESVISIDTDFDRKIDEKINNITSSLGDNARPNMSNNDKKESLSSDNIMNYFLFEEKYRGNIEEIKKRQSMFLEYFEKCKSVIDIGCGRGEFLSLLKDNSIGAKGIDTNEDMVLFCKRNGLIVVKDDALVYLNSLEDKSLDGIFSGQFVEHLQPNELINIVKLCYDKMIYGTYFIAETINPTCLGTFSTNFYMDLSHVKPIHPETFKFLLESVGFRDVQFKFFSPFHEDVKLKDINVERAPEELKKEYEILNQNFNKLNDFIFGFRDYAIIGRK